MGCLEGKEITAYEEEMRRFGVLAETKEIGGNEAQDSRQEGSSSCSPTPGRGRRNEGRCREKTCQID